MKKLLLILCVIALLVFDAGCGSSKNDQREEVQTAVALAALDAWLAEDYTTASADFSDEMRERATPEKLAAIRDGMIKEFGAFEERTKSKWQDQGEDCSTVEVTCRFARYWVKIQVAVNQDNQVVAMNLDPGKAVK